ncbi:hypothetical protein BC831DRAFT_183903 [Entophlyctis helioformis]|nr:hypothetical protein BC831DRAFT_183903 [Entophlyctis helioformis]
MPSNVFHRIQALLKVSLKALGLDASWAPKVAAFVLPHLPDHLYNEAVCMSNAENQQRRMALPALTSDKDIEKFITTQVNLIREITSDIELATGGCWQMATFLYRTDFHGQGSNHHQMICSTGIERAISFSKQQSPSQILNANLKWTFDKFVTELQMHSRECFTNKNFSASYQQSKAERVYARVLCDHPDVCLRPDCLALTARPLNSTNHSV